MFTGIIEETGVVNRIAPGKKSIQLTLQAGASAKGIKIGDSLAVNGCCLTVVGCARRANKTLLQFDLLVETWNRTNLKDAKAGSLVNLERPLRPDGRLDGHFVTGHVDGTGKILQWKPVGQDYLLEIAPPADLMIYMVPKGSVAVDGISLTVAEVKRRSFKIWIIPHTYEVTALRERSKGDAVNLETDLLGKYVIAAMRHRQ